MARASKTQIAKACERLRAHRQWLEEHGGSLTGYVERYGSVEDPEHYGDGGEAIYRADLGAVITAEAELTALLAKR